MSANRIPSNEPNLVRVVMPIIKMMSVCPMSWADREQCADAILRAYLQWKSIMDEVNTQYMAERRMPKDES